MAWASLALAAVLIYGIGVACGIWLQRYQSKASTLYGKTISFDPSEPSTHV